MKQAPRFFVSPWRAALAATLYAGLATGCSKKSEELPTPAVAVMPSEPPSPVDASKPDLPTPPAPPIVGSASAVTVVMPPATDRQGGGTVSVISGTSPPPPVVVPTSPPAAPLTAGLPAGPSARLPGATTIGPGAAPPSDQPPSVSPGTTK